MQITHDIVSISKTKDTLKIQKFRFLDSVDSVPTFS